MECGFCIDALEEALGRYGAPEIFNSDQGAQFTSAEFIGALTRRGISISMDGRGRALDNVFVERLWRLVKYEDIFLNGYRTIPEDKEGLTRYLEFYNTARYHQGLGYRKPEEVYFGMTHNTEESRFAGREKFITLTSA
ncbi:MAG: integrase core domain-containing protein [Elusimicrobiales bacterium]